MIHNIDVKFNQKENAWQVIVDRGQFIFQGTYKQCMQVAMRYSETGKVKVLK